MTFDRNPKPVQFIRAKRSRPCLPFRRQARRLCRSIRIAPHRTHSKYLRHGASPMALRVPIRPSRLCCPRRSLSQRSALGMIDGNCSSNSPSRSICALRLPGCSGSSFRNARSLSPISCTIARLCLGPMSMQLRIKKPRSGKKAPALAPTPLAALPLASTTGNSEWNRRPPLLAICASACFDNSGSW